MLEESPCLKNLHGVLTARQKEQHDISFSSALKGAGLLVLKSNLLHFFTKRATTKASAHWTFHPSFKSSDSTPALSPSICWHQRYR